MDHGGFSSFPDSKFINRIWVEWICWWKPTGAREYAQGMVNSRQQSTRDFSSHQPHQQILWNASKPNLTNRQRRWKNTLRTYY
jgi:hypothetical protein